MNRKVVMQFTSLTFVIALISWGIGALFELFGFTVENAPWVYTFIVLCGWSPTVASYIILKRNNEVKGFKEWLKNIFALKNPIRFYLLVLILIAIYFIPQVIFTGLDEAKPFYMFFAMLPLVLVGGGLEEAGWSYILRPELDKKFGYIMSSLIVAVIWTAWHIPVFLLQGRIESLSWFGLFTAMCIGWSFALGAIMRITKSVWLCVFFHTISNATAGTLYEYSDSLAGNVLASCLVIAVSLAVVFLNKNKCEAT